MNSNWLKINKFYLKKKQEKEELEKQKRHKVTFNLQPIINRVGEDLPEHRMSMISKNFMYTQSSTKPESLSTHKSKFANEEVKN